ncbi:MAG: DNA polymerase III subunit epsilon [Pseudomonadota bacterium]
MRQIVLDTETTGLETSEGHRIIEIGCIEVIDRKLTGNNYHQYINPQREIDEAAVEVHGITLESLQGKPLFADLAAELLEYLTGAELVIHNAPFDVGFLNAEFERANLGLDRIGENCSVLDTLVMARQKHPGQKNNLDALCRRYEVDNTQRTLHGALLDAEILTDVYLAMTGGQTTLIGDSIDISSVSAVAFSGEPADLTAIETPVLRATDEELASHQKWLDLLDQEAEGAVVWNHDSSEL